jgi:hypothetical protein
MNLYHSLHGKKAWSLKHDSKIHFYGKCDLFYTNLISVAQLYERVLSKQCYYVNWIETENILLNSEENEWIASGLITSRVEFVYWTSITAGYLMDGQLEISFWKKSMQSAVYLHTQMSTHSAVFSVITRHSLLAVKDTVLLR